MFMIYAFIMLFYFFFFPLLVIYYHLDNSSSNKLNFIRISAIISIFVLIFDFSNMRSSIKLSIWGVAQILFLFIYLFSMFHVVLAVFTFYTRVNGRIIWFLLYIMIAILIILSLLVRYVIF